MLLTNSRVFILQGVTKRHVADVMDQGRRAHNLCHSSPTSLKPLVCREIATSARSQHRKFWRKIRSGVQHSGIAVVCAPEHTLVVLHYTPKERPGREIHSYRMAKPGVRSSSVSHIRESQLFQPVQP